VFDWLILYWNCFLNLCCLLYISSWIVFNKNNSFFTLNRIICENFQMFNSLPLLNLTKTKKPHQRSIWELCRTLHVHRFFEFTSDGDFICLSSWICQMRSVRRNFWFVNHWVRYNILYKSFCVYYNNTDLFLKRIYDYLNHSIIMLIIVFEIVLYYKYEVVQVWIL